MNVDYLWTYGHVLSSQASAPQGVALPIVMDTLS